VVYKFDMWMPSARSSNNLGIRFCLSSEAKDQFSTFERCRNQTSTHFGTALARRGGNSLVFNFHSPSYRFNL
jgi:hypothetical protein